MNCVTDCSVSSTEYGEYGEYGEYAAFGFQIERPLDAQHVGQSARDLAREAEQFKTLRQKSGAIEDRVGGPRPPDKDDLDVHQLFVDYNFSTGKNRSLTLRVGRQEMSFGSSRLIGFREGPNIRLSFDGVRLLGKYKQWTLDGFVVKPVGVDPGFFDDWPIHGQTLWGAYAVRPLRVIAKDDKVAAKTRSARLPKRAARSRTYLAEEAPG